MGIIKNIESNFDSNGIKKSKFARWYIDSKDKTESDYNDNCKNQTNVSYEHAMNEWLMDEQVQDAIKQYLKAQRNIKMLDIYNSMYNKAIDKGDTNSAKWCSEFFKSDFFEDNVDEVDDYLSGIEIPSLKKSGGK